jgi:hypothetical protein
MSKLQPGLRTVTLDRPRAESVVQTVSPRTLARELDRTPIEDLRGPEFQHLSNVEFRLRLGTFFNTEERQLQRLRNARPDFLKDNSKTTPPIGTAVERMFKYCDRITDYTDGFADEYQYVRDTVDRKHTRAYATARLLRGSPEVSRAILGMLEEDEPKSPSWLAEQATLTHDGVIARLLDIQPTVEGILAENVSVLSPHELAQQWNSVVAGAFDSADRDLQTASDWLLGKEGDA